MRGAGTPRSPGARGMAGEGLGSAGSARLEQRDLPGGFFRSPPAVTCPLPGRRGPGAFGVPQPFLQGRGAGRGRASAGAWTASLWPRARCGLRRSALSPGDRHVHGGAHARWPARCAAPREPSVQRGAHRGPGDERGGARAGPVVTPARHCVRRKEGRGRLLRTWLAAEAPGSPGASSVLPTVGVEPVRAPKG